MLDGVLSHKPAVSEWGVEMVGMKSPAVSYKRHRFPQQIIAHSVWLYFRFPLSLRLVEELLLERGVVVS
jgi:transposase-like protein